MKKAWFFGIISVIFIAVLYVVSLYNRLVSMDVQINTQWAQVDTVLQRRFDLIPNLVESVKGYAKHEKAVFEDVTSARAAYAGAKNVGDKVKTATAFESAVSRLLMIVENYPNLKANENFARLMDQLEGTENRISVERMRFNAFVGEYNQAIRRVPMVFVAGIFRFSQRDFFQAAKGAEKVPEVKF